MSDRPRFAVLHTSDTSAHLTHRTRVRERALEAAARLRRAAFLEGEDVQAVEWGGNAWQVIEARK